jgi:hypothetical protein
MNSKTVRRKRPCSLGAKRTAFSLLMDSHERSLGSRKTPGLRHCSCWAFQCLLKVGTGQCVGFVMQSEWLVRRPLTYDFGQIVR